MPITTKYRNKSSRNSKKSTTFAKSSREDKTKFYRACGEIGRRARLRIWCFATCRFESYHAHDWTKEEFSKKRVPLFFENRQCEQQKGHAKHRASGAAWVAKSECCQFYYQNRQCRQRLVKRRTGEARTVWAAIRRRCQFSANTPKRRLVSHKRH